MLHSAAFLTGNPAIIRLLLDAGADVNTVDDGGLTPLHQGAKNGNPVVTAHLLAAGADPDALDNEGYTPLHHSNAVDGYGWSSLHFAVPLADSSVVSALLGAGADLDALTVDGLTALHLAARQGGSAVVSDLLEAGADPHAIAGGGVAGVEEAAGTSLHLAARWNDDPSVVLALLSGGADAAARDENGRRPVDYARDNDAITGSAAYSRLLVTRPTALVAGRAATGNLQSSDGAGWGFGYYDEWTYSATAGQRVVITMDSEDVDGDDLNARVQFRAPATGQNTILAASLFSETTGRYVIRVWRPAGSDGASTSYGLGRTGQSVR